MEFDEVRQALEELYLLSNSKSFEVDGKPVTVEDYKEYIREITTYLCDVLGMSEIYLGR